MTIWSANAGIANNEMSKKTTEKKRPAMNRLRTEIPPDDLG
jgi:hypothetical protein